MSFDLSDALDESPTCDDATLEPSCSDVTDVQEKTYHLDGGVTLVVSYNSKTMQCVANLVMAVNRMSKKSLKNCGRGLSNEQLCSDILDSLVEETTIGTVQQSYSKTYSRLNSIKHCTITDFLQKDVVHGPEEMKLQAITLKGGNMERKVNFTLSKYVTPNPSDKGQPVVLSIRDTDIHFSCSMDGNTAVLKLEKCLKEHLSMISDEKSMDRFLFYNIITGLNETKFESVRCPSWYISTSCGDNNEPLEMCQIDNASRLMSFKIN